MRNYYVYIAANNSKTLYIGVTNNLERRMYEHRHGLLEGFTKKYNITQLVYFEETSDVTAAIEREKTLKGWLRIKKIDLIESVNPPWNDLLEILHSVQDDSVTRAIAGGAKELGLAGEGI
jgi:putative endonuclease